jgi:hypothetical protein
MMKLASLAFVLLLLIAHAAGDGARLLGQPLSMFRDGGQGGLGYALFALLLLISGLYLTALARAGRAGEVAVAAVAALLLAVVAVTPSQGAFHLLCSLLLLGVLLCYYALLVYRAEGPWLAAVHLAVPFALAGATGLHSYGLWQKAVITYLVVVSAVHHHLLGRPPVRRARARYSGRAAGPYLSGRRHKVYALSPSREWARRAPARG